jgi:hypothetical protein
MALTKIIWWIMLPARQSSAVEQRTFTSLQNVHYNETESEPSVREAACCRE